MDGLITDAGRACAEQAKEHGWYECATLKEPYRVEGKKTMGYELAEQMGWKLPDAILYPTGGGTGLVGMWKAFAEMEAMGFVGAEAPADVRGPGRGLRADREGLPGRPRGRAVLGERHDPRPRPAGAQGPRRLPHPARAAREPRRGRRGVRGGDRRRASRSAAAAEGLFMAPEGGACVAAAAQAEGLRAPLRPDDTVVSSTPAPASSTSRTWQPLWGALIQKTLAGYVGRSTAQGTKRIYEMEGLDQQKGRTHAARSLACRVITLGITLLRLFGELQGWAPAFFSRAPGGGGAIVGISWLPLVLGPYFAVKLARSGREPASPWKAAGLAFLGLLIAMGGFAVVQALKLGMWASLPAFLLSLAVSFLPYGTWPELGRTLFHYALAARVPVVIVMLLAIHGKWGTHYDLLPPDAPPALLAMGPLELWFIGGFVPQLTVWIAYTVLVSTLLGAAVVAIVKPRASAPAAGVTAGGS